MGKSSGSSTTTTKSGPPPEFIAAYQDVLNQAKPIANAPLQQYPTGGPGSPNILAPLQPNQTTAINDIAGVQGQYQPYLAQAKNYIQNAANPITPLQFQGVNDLPGQGLSYINNAGSMGNAANFGQSIQAYQSPYTSNVTDALRNLYNEQNAEQLSQVKGNAASQGAFGGDREAIAESETARQQALAQNAALAQVQQQGYTQAATDLARQQQLGLSAGQGLLGEFNTQQQAGIGAQEATGWLNQGAGYGLANLGQENQTLGLSGAQALYGAGAAQQNQAQQALNIPYEQFIQQQAYPFQTTGWLANIAEGLGGASGGTSSTRTPGPSLIGQLGGAAAAGVGLLGQSGLFGGGGGGFSSGPGNFDPTLGFNVSPGDNLGASSLNPGGLFDFTGSADGGRVGAASGGRIDPPRIRFSDPPGLAMGGVPDLSMSIVPGANGLGDAPPLGAAGGGLSKSFMQPDTETTTKQTGGSGGILGDILGVAKIGTTIAGFFDKGGAVHGIGANFPEPASDIHAQIAALGNPHHPKDAVFVSRGDEGAIPHGLPPGIAVIRRPEGVLLTTNRGKAEAFQSPHLTESGMAHILGYAQDKDGMRAAGNAVGVQARDHQGNVITDAAASRDHIGAMVRALAPHAQGGSISITHPSVVIARRAALNGMAGQHFDDGGSVTNSGSPYKLVTIAVPDISKSYVPTTQTPPGHTFPNPPAAPPATSPISTGLDTFKSVEGLSKLFNNGSSSGGSGTVSSDYGNSLGGAVVPSDTPLQYDGGGTVPMQATGMGLAGASGPQQQRALMGQYANMSAEQLQELAMRYPATTPQGVAIARALQQRKMNPAGGYPGGPSPSGPYGASGDTSPGTTAARGGRMGYEDGGGLAAPSDVSPEDFYKQLIEQYKSGTPLQKKMMEAPSYDEGQIIPRSNPSQDAAFDAELQATRESRQGNSRDSQLLRELSTMRQQRSDQPTYPYIRGREDLADWPHASMQRGGRMGYAGGGLATLADLDYIPDSHGAPIENLDRYYGDSYSDPGMMPGGSANTNDILYEHDLAGRTPLQRYMMTTPSYEEGQRIPVDNPAGEAAFNAERQAMRESQLGHKGRDDPLWHELSRMRAQRSDQPTYPNIAGMSDAVNWPQGSMRRGGQVGLQHFDDGGSPVAVADLPPPLDPVEQYFGGLDLPREKPGAGLGAPPPDTAAAPAKSGIRSDAGGRYRVTTDFGSDEANAAIGAPSGLAAVPSPIGPPAAPQIRPPNVPGEGPDLSPGSNGRFSLGQMTQLAKNSGFSDEKAPVMAAIAMGESHGDPSAHNTNKEDSYGLTQINADAHGPKARGAFNPQRAFDLAFDISKGGTDFSPWSVYNSGEYRSFLGGDQGPENRNVESPPGRGLASGNEAIPQGLAQGPPPAAPAPVASSAATTGSGLSPAIDKILKDISNRAKPGSDFATSPWMALTAAGLGAMASRSPFPGVAFGEGGLMGLKMLENQQAQLPKNELERSKADLARLELNMLPLKMQAGIDSAAAFTGALPTGGTATTGTTSTSAPVPPPLPPSGGTAPDTSTSRTTNVAATTATPAAPTAAAAKELMTPAANALAEIPGMKAQGAAPAQIAQAVGSAAQALPAPPASQNNPILAQYDQQYAAIKRAIVNLAPFSPEKLPALMEGYQRVLMSDPRNLALAEQMKGEAAVGPAVRKATEIAKETMPYKIQENLAFRAGMPVAVRPGEAVITGAQLMGPGFGMPGFTPPGQPSGGQAPVAGPSPSPSLPAPPTAAPFASPGDLQADPTLNQPTVRLVPAPGGGMTAAPTLPGLSELQKKTGDLAAEAQKNVPVLAQAEAGLDAQHQEIISAAADRNFYTPGAFSDARKRVGTVINTVADLVGAPGMKLQPEQLGEATAIDKAAFGLSTQAVHGISARPAQIEWQSARNSVPNNELPAFSAILLSNTLRFQNQYQKGQAEYELQQYKNGADPSAAAATWQATNGNRVAGAALAQTYIDLAKARPDDPSSQWVRRLFAVPPEQRAVAVREFDKRFTPLNGVNSAAFDVRSWGTLMLQLGSQ